MEKLSIRPVIQNSQIVSVEIEGASLPLRSPLAIDELPELIKALETFVQYIDVQKLGNVNGQEVSENEWKESDLRRFVLNELSDNQATALRILVESEEITREKYVGEMRKRLGNKDFNGWALGGLLRSITVKSRNYGYSSLYEKEWRVVGNEYECFYRLSEGSYRSKIGAALEERLK